VVDESHWQERVATARVYFAVAYLMKMTIRFGLPAIKLGLAIALMAQVQTDVPPAVRGAKPVTVEHIKIHGKALEGNLEGRCSGP
jgi:hypothetical protein